MKKDIEQKVQEALDSLDGIQRAEPQPFFYTRLMGRMTRDEKTIWETMGSYLARPAVALAGLCLILILNITILLKQDDSNSNNTAAFTTEQGIADNEYILASSSSFDYENLDQ